MNEEKSSVIYPSADDREKIARPEVEMISYSDALDIKRVVAAVETQIETFRQIRQICLRLTNNDDWLIQGDGISLLESGAQKIAIPWGCDVHLTRIDLEWIDDPKSRYYIYTAYGHGYSKKLGRDIDDIGTCSSRDEFFAKKGGEFKKLEDVDMTDIKKKAVTNLYVRLIRRCLGISNVSENELTAAGIDLSKVARVEYDAEKRKKPDLPPEAKTRKDAIRNILNVLSNGDETKSRAILKDATYFKSGDKEVFAETVEDLRTEKWVNAIYGKMKDHFRKTNPDDFAKMFPDDVAKTTNGTKTNGNAPTPPAATETKSEPPFVLADEKTLSAIGDCVHDLLGFGFSEEKVYSEIQKNAGRQIAELQELTAAEAFKVFNYLDGWRRDAKSKRARKTS